MNLTPAVVAMALLGPSAAFAGPLVIVGEGVPPEQARALVDDGHATGVEVVQAREPKASPVGDVLEEARRLFREMDFQRAALRLSAAEPNLIDGRTPSPQLVAELVDLETWLGACLLFSHNAPDAAERFALVRALDPNARPDPVFPPEVARAFGRAAATPPIAVRVRLAPSDSRLWIDGKPAVASPTLRPGLHYVVAERADRRPVATMVRVSPSLPEIAVSLGDVASRPESLEQAARQAQRGPLGRDEAAAVASLQGRALWIVSLRDGRVMAARRSPDPAEEPRTISIDRLDGAVRAICRAEHACADEAQSAVVAATMPGLVAGAPAPSPKVRHPVWKRGWFWAVIGVSAAVVAGGIAGAVVATTPRDYAARLQ